MRWRWWSSPVVAWCLLASGPAWSSPTLVQLRDEARQFVINRCGSCHSSTSPKAMPGALKVYDINQVDWTKGMSDQQVKNILQRFRGPVIPQDEIDRVTAFVEAELSSRKTRTQ